MNPETVQSIKVLRDWYTPRPDDPACLVLAINSLVGFLPPEPEVDTPSLTSIISDTTDEMFQIAGGFDFTDELALALDAKWRKQEHGPVVVSAVDLSWLLEGYARARLSALRGVQ